MILVVLLCILSTSYVRSHKLTESGCGNGYYECSGYNIYIAKYVYLKCINENLICDGVKNCYYGEDEEDCYPTTIPTVTTESTTIPTTMFKLQTTMTKPTSTVTVETMSTSTSIFESTTILPIENNKVDTSTFLVATLPDTTISSTSDDSTTSNDTSYKSIEESITTQLIDTYNSDIEDKANRDYKALIISIIISILISLVFVTSVLIHWKLARRRKRSEMSTGTRFRMTQRKHGNNPA